MESRTPWFAGPMRRCAGILATAVVMCGATASGVQAAAGGVDVQRVLTSPSELLASIQPGSATRAQLLVVNQSASPARVTISVADLVPDPSSSSFGVLDEGASSHQRGAGSWLRPEVTALTLAPRERRKVAIAITAPATASPGGHYGAVIVATAPTPGANRDDVEVRLRLVTNVTVNVPGLIGYEGRIERLRVERRGDHTLRVRGLLHNAGDVHTKPHDVRIVVDGRGAARATRFELPRTMPGARRSFSQDVRVDELLDHVSVSVRGTMEDERPVRPATAKVWVWSSSALRIAIVGIGLLAALAVALVVRRRREFQRLVDEELARMTEAGQGPADT